MMQIAVDAMGGDFGPEVTLPACLEMLKQHDNLVFLLVGDQNQLKALHEQSGYLFKDRLLIEHASEVVAMDDLPSVALRTKKDSSMRVALNRVASGRVDACVSAGNTGALMATAKFVLKMIPGVSRPAILTRMPTVLNTVTRVLDLGANIDSSPEQLMQYAVMGSIVAKTVGGIDEPSIGLLNVGEEEVKGSPSIKQAAALLRNIDGINYIGFVEGSDWFSGAVDVVVCDGLVGNIALKAVEGISRLFAQYLVGSFKRNIFSQLSGLLAKPVLNSFKGKVDARNFNGATLVGVNGVVIKSHGSADVHAFKNALKEAMDEVEKQVPILISEKFDSIISTEQDN